MNQADKRNDKQTTNNKNVLRFGFVYLFIYFVFKLQKKHTHTQEKCLEIKEKYLTSLNVRIA